MKTIIESETEDDYEHITRFHITAFKGDGETKLVEKLWKTTEYIPKLSLVAKYETKIIGHILLYPIKIINEKEDDTLALAPISVLPKFQGNEIGSKFN